MPINENIALMAMWIPDLDGRRGPKYMQIVEALAEDIGSGALAPGARVPPHRELAFTLGLSPQTASRAYAEGVRRALLRGEVGRGTFVRAGEPPSPFSGTGSLDRPTDGPVDLSRNLPAPGQAPRHLEQILQTIGRSGGLPDLLDHTASGARPDHAEAALAWLSRSGVPATRDELVLTNGAQHGIYCALSALTRPGDVLLVEELSYAPVHSMAERLGLKLATVKLDGEGVCADALAEACGKTGATALYVTPTLQSPTTVTMSALRRKEIAMVARKAGLVVIEDDVFGLLKPDAPAPLTAQMPEGCVYVTSVSKCLAPGLRIGFVRAPAALAPAIRHAVLLTCWMVPPLMMEVTARLVREGIADRLIAQQRKSASRRQDIARAVLGGHPAMTDRHGLHLWLPLPAHWPAGGFRAEAESRGVKLTDGSAFAAVPRAAPNAVRLCLSHEADEGRLRQGLQILRDMLDARPPPKPLTL